MNEIKLNCLELKTFTEQDAEDYCILNNINQDKVIELNLSNNELTDISGIKIFENIEILRLSENKLTDISAVKYLNKLEVLELGNNKLKDISVLKNLTRLKTLYLSDNNIKDISVIQYFKNLEILGIINLELESDQIQYINKCKNLKYLWSSKGFKDISILKQLNSNIKLWQ